MWNNFVGLSVGIYFSLLQGGTSGHERKLWNLELAKAVDPQQEQRDVEWCPSPHVDTRMSHTLQVWSYRTPLGLQKPLFWYSDKNGVRQQEINEFSQNLSPSCSYQAWVAREKSGQWKSVYSLKKPAPNNPYCFMFFLAHLFKQPT